MNADLRDDLERQNYILSLTEQDAINARQNARGEARKRRVKFNQTAAFLAYEEARAQMQELLWIGPALGSGTHGSTCVDRLNAGKPILSLDNLKFAFWPAKASYNAGGYSN